MYYFDLLEKRQRSEYLNSEGANGTQLEGNKVVGLEQFIQALTQYFGYDADVSPEDDKVFDAQDVFHVLDVILFNFHEDIDLIER